jgi:hypothetical protein
MSNLFQSQIQQLLAEADPQNDLQSQVEVPLAHVAESINVIPATVSPTCANRSKATSTPNSTATSSPKTSDNFRMNTGMVDTAPLIIWLL